MTPQARAQAAIEVLDGVIEATRGGGAAADTIVQRYFKQRRYAGSKDRRAVRELVYAAIRRAGDLPVSGRAALIGVAGDEPSLAALFDASPHAPVRIVDGEPIAPAGEGPAWLDGRLDGIGLLGRAPLDVRVNTLKASRETLAISGSAPTPHAPDGLRLPEGTRVEALPEWRDGLIEVQDEGSQLVAIACDARPGMTVVDLCAGAGGKTLALAAAMRNDGAIVAADTDRARLSRLPPRVERAGIDIVTTALLDPGREAPALADLTDRADLVVIDAPCSGTGTWRRNPEARWRLSEERLARLVHTQARLLEIGAALVRPGGALAYIVCSLLGEEGAEQAGGFLVRHRGWRVDQIALPAGTPDGAGLRLTPAQDGTDGFFVARLRRPC
ncbi:RsmB/NOP family class I SAM-dependent RNA methyltransferase [Sphingomonas sp.]|uniref:RsmB/NOP family class I SAM-dependent RNA methyltransferase n=1 Tax=Sphingomonas sp. TaxID=28214 RepID=UPI003AFF950E